MDRINAALSNLALAATNNTTVLQQLTTTNVVLTASLTTASKKFSEAMAEAKGAPTPARMPGPLCVPKPHNAPFPRNNCWTHCHRCNRNHTSAICTNKTEGPKDNATTANTMGGSKVNRWWNTRGT